MDSIIHSIQNVHLKESKLDEEDSYNFLQEYLSTNSHYYKYSYPDISKDEIYTLISTFCFFCATVKDLSTNKSYPSNIPITIFRYLLLDDGTWSLYYTVRKKRGRVVEGMQWSNGLFYQVREDKKDGFELHEATLLVDAVTKTMYNFP